MDIKDLDKAFGFGALFGAGVIGTALGIKKLLDSVKRIRMTKNAATKLYAEIDQRIYRNKSGH